MDLILTSINNITKEEMGYSEWIDLFGIIITALLSWWIVNTIQKRIDNQRTLKDHLISEILSIRTDYRLMLIDIKTGESHPKYLKIKLKDLNIKTTDIMKIVSNKYRIDNKYLKHYQHDLNWLITDNEEYVNSFKTDSKIILSQESMIHFLIFEANNDHLFNDLIVRINDSN
ncbi:hypothetical protein [Bacteroides ihuae]|uniref:hypothetical protein n=1 Tax=Bacteroides ihuae TaxID=1852362 RepID=UPI0008DAB803|nr:hypothetical protein [Bacteroides ihuae]